MGFQLDSAQGVKTLKAIGAHSAVALAAEGIALGFASLHHAEPALGPLPHPVGDVVALIRVTRQSSTVTGSFAAPVVLFCSQCPQTWPSTA